MNITIGTKVRAIVVRPYNGHELTIFGVIIKISDGSFIVKQDCKNIEFLISDIGKTVFLVDDNWDDINIMESNKQQRDEHYIGILPHSECARVMSCKNAINKQNEEMKEIISSINISMDHGVYETEINFHITKETMDILEAREYKLTFGSQVDSPYTKIRW
jgi:hypothetical protein